MSRPYRVALLPGDGVGPEVLAAARLTLEAVAARFRRQFAFDTHPIGGAALDAGLDPLPAATLAACRAADAVLLGAVGGPAWNQALRRPEEGLLALRAALGLYANIRPVRAYDSLIAHSPLRPEIVRGVDFVLYRELTGGLYFGDRRRGPDWASDECRYSTAEIERVARRAFHAARARRGHVCSIDKANVLETSRLWRAVTTRVGAHEFPDMRLSHMLVDSAAMQIIREPQAFDVILTENLFGDILSDEASILPGSIGLAPSASLGDSGPGLFEPVHGSAPDIAGRDLANPIGAVLSAAMMLDLGLGLSREARAIENAVAMALAAGAGTADIGGELGCGSMAARIAEAVAAVG